MVHAMPGIDSLQRREALLEPAGSGSGLPSGASLEVQVLAGLQACIGDLTAELRDSKTRWQTMAANCWPVSIPSQGAIPATGNLTITNADLLGPKTGYAWLIQRVTVGGLVGGATPDTVSIYRGKSTADLQPQNLLNVVTGNAPTWHPGARGMILREGESLIASGTSLAATGLVAMSTDVIQVALPLLVEYLL